MVLDNLQRRARLRRLLADLPSSPARDIAQRSRAVVAAVERHLRPLLIGRDVDRIEEIYQLSCVNGYWRNGPVLNNAISGVDQAVGHQGQARGHTDKKRSARLVEVLGRAALAASNPGRFRAS